MKSNSLAVAYNVQNKNKRKKMAKGGEVYSRNPGTPEAKPDNHKIPESESMSDHMAQGGEVACMHCAGSGKMMSPEIDDSPEMMAEGGEIDSPKGSIVDSIMNSRRMEQVDLEANDTEGPATDISHNIKAKEWTPTHEDSIEPQPTDSNEHSDSIEADKHDRVAEIRKRLKRG